MVSGDSQAKGLEKKRKVRSWLFFIFQKAPLFTFIIVTQNSAGLRGCVLDEKEKMVVWLDIVKTGNTMSAETDGVAGWYASAVASRSSVNSSLSGIRRLWVSLWPVTQSMGSDKQ